MMRMTEGFCVGGGERSAAAPQRDDVINMAGGTGAAWHLTARAVLEHGGAEPAPLR